jgi:hypothetical protein
MSSTAGRNLRWRLAVAVAFALGTVATLVPAAAAMGAQPGKRLPFIGYVKGLVTPQFAPGFPLARDTFGGRCSTPSDWIASWSGTGWSNVTGPITAYGSDCDQIDLTTGNITYGDGVITEYGPDGDLIYGTYTNGHGKLGSTLSDNWTLVGGTGRFAGVTGQGVETFTLLVPASSLTFTSQPLPFVNPWLGWISYGGPHR